MDGPSQSRSRESVGLFYLFVGARGFDENPSFDKTAGLPFWTLRQQRPQGEAHGWAESIPLTRKRGPFLFIC